MTGADEPREEPGAADAAEAAEARDAARAERERKRRLAEIFGDVLPDSSRDDTDEAGERGTSEEWLKRQVPPHHG